MKLCLVAHGYPPELTGGTEETVRTLAHGLAARGHEVLVVAGSMDHHAGFRTTEERDGPVRVVRIHRDDLYFDHWQKSGSPRVRAAFARVLEQECPDLVHVHHWIRLSRDLVATAARLRIPAVVTLHDLWTTCLVTFRVRPDTHAFCTERLGPEPCLACAGRVPPATPWLGADDQARLLAERQADLLRELELARAVVVPSRTHGDAIARFLGLDSPPVTVVPPGRDLLLGPAQTLPLPERGEAFRLGCWGHLHPLKGQDLVVEAVRRAAECAPITLELAGGEGDPAFAAALRSAAAGLDVRFHGAYTLDQLGAHPVTRVHAMVSGTRALESYGLVLDEAVALGLPMVLPRAGAYAERLAEGRGVRFYEPGSVASLAQVLAELASDPGGLASLRAGLPAPREVTSTEAEHEDALLRVYERALARGAPAAPEPDPSRDDRLQAEEDAWADGFRNTHG